MAARRIGLDRSDSISAAEVKELADEAVKDGATRRGWTRRHLLFQGGAPPPREIARHHTLSGFALQADG
jgi:hypothetical protein